MGNNLEWLVRADHDHQVEVNLDNIILSQSVTCCTYHERSVHDHLDDGLGLWLYFVIKVCALTWKVIKHWLH